MKPLRLAIVKPDHGIRGGFELVVDRIVEHLADRGHRIDRLSFPGAPRDHRPFGRRIPDHDWERCPELFTHLSLLEVCRTIDASSADVLISTQPPTYAVSHPRHLALFSHHARMFYDLADAVTRAGMVDPVVHTAACEAVRAVDQPHLAAVGRILAASETVKDRLHTFNGLDATVGVYHAGASFTRGVPEPRPDDRQRHALCVSRHEFPKRTELFVAATAIATDVPALAIGGGGRLGWIGHLHRRLRTSDPASWRDEDLWLNNPPWMEPLPIDDDTNLRFTGHVSDDELDRAYRDALCIVAPAYLEDYGLTAIEAMAYAKPLVVCRDGGYLARFVEHGVNGLVVEPTASSIAAAISELAADPRRAAEMGAAGRELAMTFTWHRAMAEIDEGLEQVLS